MTQPDPSKYVASSGPVNRRTTGRRDPLPTAPVNPVVQERLAAAKARHRLGPPLAEQLLVRPAVARPPIKPLAVAGAILSAASATGLFLAWLQLSWLLASAAAVGLLAGVLLVVRNSRSDGAAPSEAPPPAQLFDEAQLQAIDRTLDRLAPELPDGVATELVEFKHLVVRIGRHPGAAVINENFTLEDRMYVRECITRYLPDSLEGYIAVPARDRGTTLADGQSAESLLAGQLAMLRSELERREARMAIAAAEPLLKQQRFLKAKGGR